MPLIKHHRAPELTTGAVVLDLGDLRRQAEAIMAEARADAAAIRAEAEAEAQRIIEAAAPKGHAEGLAQGLAEGRECGESEGRAEAHTEWTENLEALTGAWQAALERWEQSFASMLMSAREDVLRLALAIARKIVLRDVHQRPTIVRDQVTETLALLCRPASVTIVVNPADRPLVEEALPALMQKVAACEHARVQSDPSMTRGGCLVRSEHGKIDARIETQLERITEALLPDEPLAPGQAGASS